MKLFNLYPKYLSVFEKDINGREINIYKFNNCIPTGINTYYPNILLQAKSVINAELIQPIYERTMSLDNAYLNAATKTSVSECARRRKLSQRESRKQSSLSRPINPSQVYEEPVFFFVYNTDNYFHFLYDTLPYLISFIKLKASVPNLKLLMQYPNEQKQTLYPFVTEFLEILNIEYIILDSETMYNTVYISNSYTHDIDSNLPPRQEIYEFYQNIAQTVTKGTESSRLDTFAKRTLFSSGSVEGKGGNHMSSLWEDRKVASESEWLTTPPKIYVSRRTWVHNDKSNIGTDYTTRRVLVNETELVNALARDGYVEVFTEKLSTVEKIAYFANATHVAGAIGGGISNVLFSPKHIKLIAYVSPTFLEVNKRFKYSLDCVDVYYNTSGMHTELSDFKTNMRVKTIDGIVGEIIKVELNTVTIAYTTVPVAGWNSQNDYKVITTNISNVVKIDNGLNSPWIIHTF
jgi:capsular polysaccharide biosynthesis protein